MTYCEAKLNGNGGKASSFDVEWFRLMGGLQAKSMMSQRNRAVRR